MKPETNKIYLGDCTEIMKDFDDDCVDIVFTSPPYNRVRDDVYSQYKESDVDYAELLDNFTENAIRIAKDKVIVNIQQTYFNKKILFNWIGKWANNISGTAVWIKTNARPSVNYDGETRSVTNGYETFYFLNKDGEKFRSYGEENTLNYIITPVNDVHYEGHSAIMKYDVAEYFIKHFTKENDLVLDSFMGMGTTAIVCNALNRRWTGIELNEEYINQSYNRIKCGSQTLLF